MDLQSWVRNSVVDTIACDPRCPSVTKPPTHIATLSLMRIAVAQGALGTDSAPPCQWEGHICKTLAACQWTAPLPVDVSMILAYFIRCATIYTAIGRGRMFIPGGTRQNQFNSAYFHPSFSRVASGKAAVTRPATEEGLAHVVRFSITCQCVICCAGNFVSNCVLRMAGL